MKSEILDYVLDSVLGIMESLMLDEHYQSFKEQHPGLDWTLPYFEDTIHKFCGTNIGKELMITYIVNFIKENNLEEL